MKCNVVYVLCVLLSALCCGCENNINEVMALQEKSTGIEVAQHVRMLYSQSARVKAEVTAPQLYRYLNNPPHVLLNKGLKAQFFDDSLQVQSVLTAKTGEYYENTNQIVVKDSVVVINKKGEKLECEELHWDAQKQRFFSNTPVKITTPTQLIYGKGLEAPADFSWYQVLQVQNSNIQVDENQLP